MHEHFDLGETGINRTPPDCLPVAFQRQSHSSRPPPPGIVHGDPDSAGSLTIKRRRTRRPGRANTEIGTEYARCPHSHADCHRLTHDMLKETGIDAENRGLHVGRIGNDPTPEDRRATGNFGDGRRQQPRRERLGGREGQAPLAQRFHDRLGIRHRTAPSSVVVPGATERSRNALRR